MTILSSFTQTQAKFLLMLNTKEDILMNAVTNQFLVPIDFHNIFVFHTMEVNYLVTNILFLGELCLSLNTVRKALIITLRPKLNLIWKNTIHDTTLYNY